MDWTNLETDRLPFPLAEVIAVIVYVVPQIWGFYLFSKLYLL